MTKVDLSEFTDEFFDQVLRDIRAAGQEFNDGKDDDKYTADLEAKVERLRNAIHAIAAVSHD